MDLSKRYRATSRKLCALCIHLFSFHERFGPYSADLHLSRCNRLKSCLFFLIQMDETMHHLYSEASSLTGEIIAAAIEVHREMGPGLLESIYEWCLIRELELRGLRTNQQKQVVIHYKGATREEPLRFDVLVNGCVLVEVKAVEAVLKIHKAQLLSYMKLLDIPIGLVLNFHEMKLTDGVSRLILKGADGDRL